MRRFRTIAFGFAISAGLSLALAPLIAQQLSGISVYRRPNVSARSGTGGNAQRQQRSSGRIVETRTLAPEPDNDESGGEITLAKTSDGRVLTTFSGQPFRPPRPTGRDARHFSTYQAMRVFVDRRTNTYHMFRLTGTDDDNRRTAEYLQRKYGVDVGALRARVKSAAYIEPPAPARLPSLPSLSALRQARRPRPFSALPRLRFVTMQSDGSYECHGYGLNQIDGKDPIDLHLTRTYSWASFDDYYDFSGGWYSTASDAYWYTWAAQPTSAGTYWYYDPGNSWINAYADAWGAGVEQQAFFYNWNFDDPNQRTTIYTWNEVSAGENWGWSDQTAEPDGEDWWFIHFDIVNAKDGYCYYY